MPDSRDNINRAAENIQISLELAAKGFADSLSDMEAAHKQILDGIENLEDSGIKRRLFESIDLENLKRCHAGLSEATLFLRQVSPELNVLYGLIQAQIKELSSEIDKLKNDGESWRDESDS